MRPNRHFTQKSHITVGKQALKKARPAESDPCQARTVAGVCGDEDATFIFFEHRPKHVRSLSVRNCQVRLEDGSRDTARQSGLVYVLHHNIADVYLKEV